MLPGAGNGCGIIFGTSCLSAPLGEYFSQEEGKWRIGGIKPLDFGGGFAPELAMEYVFAPAAPASVEVVGLAARFAVRRIYCVGRNYSEHAREMGNDPAQPPFFFSKPADALVANGARVAYPGATENLHFEAELVVAVGRAGAAISVADAPDHIWGYAVGIDLTRRDLQSAAKAAGRPWDMAKGFDNSAPCGALSPVRDVGHLREGAIRLHQNGELRQNGDIGEMIWPVADIVAQLSGLVALAPGDLIFTGTPAGVGPVVRGDRLEVEIVGLSGLAITIE